MNEKRYQLALEVNSDLLTLSFETNVLYHCTVPLPYQLTHQDDVTLEEYLQINYEDLNCFAIGQT